MEWAKVAASVFAATLVTGAVLVVGWRSARTNRSGRETHETRRFAIESLVAACNTTDGKPAHVKLFQIESSVALLCNGSGVGVWAGMVDMAALDMVDQFVQTHQADDNYPELFFQKLRQFSQEKRAEVARAHSWAWF